MSHDPPMGDIGQGIKTLEELCRATSDAKGNFRAVTRGDRWPEVVRLRHLWWSTLASDCGWSPGRIAHATGFSKASVRAALFKKEGVG